MAAAAAAVAVRGLHHHVDGGRWLLDPNPNPNPNPNPDPNPSPAPTQAGGSEALGETYIAAMSSRTIVYKGMTQSAVLGPFYEDLQDPRYFTNFAIYHRRFSTNTVPKWPLNPSLSPSPSPSPSPNPEQVATAATMA